MPSLSPSDAALIRSGTPVVKYYLAIMPRTVVFSCALDNASATYGLTTLSYDNVTVGAWTDVVIGQTLEVLSSGSVVKGTVRIRAITAATIKVAAQYDIEWEDDDILHALDVFEPWSVPTGLEDTGSSIIYYKDTDIVWVDNDTAFPPVSHDLGAWAGFYESQESLGVAFDATGAFTTAPGATIDSYARPVRDGAFISGSQSTAQAAIRFPVGFRWITTTVTDSNSKTALMRTPVWVFGGGYQPFTDFSIKRRTEAVRDCTLSIEAFGDDVDGTSFPEGSMIVVFSRTYINGVEVDLDRAMGCPLENRAQIKFTGYILKDTVRWDAEDGVVTFEAGTVGKIADDMPGYPTFIKDVSSGDATDWHDGEALTVRSTISFLLRWHTNLLELVPFEIEPVELIAGRKFPRAAPMKQVESAFLLQRGVFALLGISRWGTAHIRYNPQELSDAARDSRDTVMDLTSEDWLTELEIMELSRPAASSVFGGGIYYDGTDGTPLRGRSPGIVGRQSSKEVKAHNLIVVGQDDLNAKLGRLLGASSLQLEAGPIELFWDVFSPALQEYIALTVNSNDNLRGIELEQIRFIVRELTNEAPSNDTPTSRLRLELLSGELEGTFQGITVTIPDPPEIPNPPPPPPIPPPYIPPEPVDWPTKVLVGTMDGGIFYTEDFSGPEGGQPTWTDIRGDLPTVGGRVELIKLQISPVDPLNTFYVQLSGSYAAPTRKAIYMTTDRGVTWNAIFNEISLQDPNTDDIKDFCVDPVTGMMLVSVRGVSSPITYIGIFYTTVFELPIQWIEVENPGAGRYNFGIGGLESYDGRIGLGHSPGGGGQEVIFGDVESFDVTIKEGSGSAVWVSHALKPILGDTHWHYLGLWNGDNYQLARVIAPGGTPEALAAGLEFIIEFTRQDRLWFSREVDEVRYIEPGSYEDTRLSRLIVSGDNFESSADVYLFTGLYNIGTICDLVRTENDDYIIYGTDPGEESSDESLWPTKHAVGVADINDPTDFSGKAGELPDTVPFTDSIPSNSGGPCTRGIQVLG